MINLQTSAGERNYRSELNLEPVTYYTLVRWSCCGIDIAFISYHIIWLILRINLVPRLSKNRPTLTCLSTQSVLKITQLSPEPIKQGFTAWIFFQLVCHLNLRKLHEQPGYEVMCVIQARPSLFLIGMYIVFLYSCCYVLCMYAAVITLCLLMNSGKSMTIIVTG